MAYPVAPWRLALHLAGLGAVVLLVGCVPPQMIAPSVGHPAPPADGKKVLEGGACLELGEAEKPAVTREAFLRKVNDLLAAERFESARRFTWRYPDVAQETLRNATAEQVGTAALQAIARHHDEQCGTPDAPDSWLALIQDRAAHPDRYAAYSSARQQLMDLLRSGKAHEAAEVRITRDVPAGLLEIDAQQLLAEARLLDEKPAEAITALSAALKRAQAGHPYEAAQVMLLLGEAQRRAGKIAEGTGTWQQAVILIGQLLTRRVPVADPILWERAAYLRPVQSSWPESVIQQLTPPGTNAARSVQPPPGRTSLEEAWLWTHIGRWRLVRNEAQGALVAFKRAESLTLDQRFQERLQLDQALAVAQLNQSGAALAILVRIAARSTSPVAVPALAMVGAIKLKEGSTQQALAALSKAVEQAPSSDWPGRSEAEADLGLAYLMTGDEASGLRCLHSAQAHFTATDERDLLLQCLDNEAHFWEHKGKAEEVQRIRQRLRELEGNTSRPGAVGR